MAKAIYQWPSDQILSAATVSLGTGSTAIGYALANLCDGNPAGPGAWRAAAATAFDLLMDFGVIARAIKLFGFHGHNFDPGITFTIQANATNSWGAPSFSATVTVPAAAADGYGQDFYWLSLSQTTSYRWWRLHVTATNSVAWQLGELWVSTKVDRYLPQNNYQQDGLSLTDLRAGVETLTPLNTSMRTPDPSRRVRISGTVKGTRAEILAVRDWKRACRGLGSPTCFILEDDDANKEAFFVVHEDTHEGGLVIGQIWQAQLALRTLSAGLSVF